VRKKESVLLAYNEVAKLDRVLYEILDAMSDLSSDLQSLPAVKTLNPKP
jgi:hypothetical protein